jgi:hypothetical protein
MEEEEDTYGYGDMPVLPIFRAYFLIKYIKP